MTFAAAHAAYLTPVDPGDPVCTRCETSLDHAWQCNTTVREELPPLCEACCLSSDDPCVDCAIPVSGVHPSAGTGATTVRPHPTTVVAPDDIREAGAA